MFIINSQGRRKAFIAVFTLLFFSCTTEASAQRTMNGQLYLSAEGHLSALNFSDAGGAIDMGQYMLNGHWYCRILSSYNTVSIGSGRRLGYIDFLAQGGYLYRIVSSRSRRFIFYGGGGAFIGYEVYDPFGRVPSHLQTNLPEGGTFLYGIDPRLELEAFISRNIAIILGMSSPINFSSELSKVRPRVSLGVRIDI